MNILQLSAELAALVPAMAQDSVVNNEQLIRGLLEREQKRTEHVCIKCGLRQDAKPEYTCIKEF